MALIVEDGSGIPDAESMATVAFFRDFHGKRGNDVTGLSDETIEQLLRKATDYAVDTYAGLWAGIPATTVQNMPFPRIVGGVNIGLPVSIQQAIVELALVARTTPLMPSVSRGKKKVKIGPLEVEYDGNAPTATVFTSASLKFAPFLKTGVGRGVNARLVRC